MLALLSFLLSFVSVCSYNSWRTLNPIQITSSIQAQEYGESIAKWIYPDSTSGKEGTIDYSKYILKYEETPNEWKVWYSLNRAPNRWVLGGGGPAIHFDKNTGKIVSWNLQK